MRLTDEPTNEAIDDYDNNESPEKRKTIYIIIGVLILVGLVSFVLLKPNVMPSDYVGTNDKPGILLSNGH